MALLGPSWPGFCRRPMSANDRPRTSTLPRQSPDCDNTHVATTRKHVRLADSELAGLYEVVERRRDGSLVLRPEQERLSDVLLETEGDVFQDEEFISHLERVAATEDDLPADERD